MWGTLAWIFFCLFRKCNSMHCKFILQHSIYFRIRQCMKFLICHFSQILIPSNICDITNNNRVDIICFTIIHYCSGHFMKIVVNTVSLFLIYLKHMFGWLRILNPSCWLTAVPLMPKSCDFFIIFLGDFQIFSSKDKTCARRIITGYQIVETQINW